MTTSRLFTPLARSLAIASLTGAALLAGSFGPVIGADRDHSRRQGDPSGSRRGHQQQARDRRAAHRHAEDVAQDHARPGEKWDAVAKSMRDNAATMEKLVATKRAIRRRRLKAVDDLKTYQEFTQVRLDGLKDLNSAFKSLYDSMPAEQKKNADMVFEKYGPSKPATAGLGGPS